MLMVLAVVSQPSHEYNFDRLIRICRITEDYVAKVSSKYHNKREIYKVDTTLTADSYFYLITKEVIPIRKEKMNFPDFIIIQKDNVRLHDIK